MLTAEIIAIGSELLMPDKADTNSLWLTEKLNEIGIEVKLKTIVGDDGKRLEETIKDAVKRANLIITTGGLGPTEDDITRRFAAKALKRKLIEDKKILADIRHKFETVLKRPMPEINARQAQIIEGAEVLPNPHGTAPGMFVTLENAMLVVLPGPPREMKPMFEDFILPKLRGKAGEISVKRRTLRVAGMGESAVDEKIAPIYTKYQNPQTTILFNRFEVEIRLTATGKNEAEADALNAEVAEKIVAELGTAVFSQNGETMEEIIAQLLTAKGKTLAVAESCTGGLIGERLTEVPGSSAYFVGGIVSYSNDLKVKMLNVSPILIDNFGAVSGEVATAMAVGIRHITKADFAISVTGIAGPTGGTEEKPVGLVYIAYSDSRITEFRKLNLPGDRHLIRRRASQAALDLLRKNLLKLA